jgi:hypothetical protein
MSLRKSKLLPVLFMCAVLAQALAPAGGAPVSASSVAAPAASAGCRGYWKDQHIRSGPIESATAHMNVGVCWNGRRAWKTWGVDAAVTTIPLLLSETTWSGAWTGSDGWLHVGINYWIAPFNAPWWHRYGYARFDISPNGVANAVWGHCC